MYQLLLYFFCNLLGFFVFYLIWKRLDKPDPYDYTTIPGLKCEDLLLTKSAIVLPFATPINKISQSRGNFTEIRELGSVPAFFEWLHAVYGKLAVFYWGPRYTVSVGSMELVYELEKFKDFLKPLNPLLYASILFGCPYAWNLLSDYKKTPGDCSKAAAEQQSTLFMNYDPKMETGAPIGWPTKWITGPLCLVFDREIELDAHQIPAGIPILLNVSLLLDGDKSTPESINEKFKWIFDRCLNEI